MKRTREQRKQPSGFTLIEILVVLVIMGIMLALIAIKLTPDDKRVLETEALRLSLLLEQAHDEAVAGAQQIAWTADAGGYRFWRRDEKGAWLPYQGEELFRERAFGDGVRFVGLQLDHAWAEPGQRLVFSPSGMGLPFSAVLALGGERLAVSGDGFGQVRVGAENGDAGLAAASG